MSGCNTELSTLCSLISTLCSLISTWCPLISTWCPLISTWCPLISTWCPLISTWCPLISTWCPLISTLCPLVRNRSARIRAASPVHSIGDPATLFESINPTPSVYGAFSALCTASWVVVWGREKDYPQQTVVYLRY